MNSINNISIAQSLTPPTGPKLGGDQAGGIVV